MSLTSNFDAARLRLPQAALAYFRRPDVAIGNSGANRRCGTEAWTLEGNAKISKCVAASPPSEPYEKTAPGVSSHEHRSSAVFGLRMLGTAARGRSSDTVHGAQAGPCISCSNHAARRALARARQGEPTKGTVGP